MKKKKIHPIQVIGRKEFFTIPFFNNITLEAKIDTGAYSTSIYCINVYEKDSVLYFTLPQYPTINYEYKKYELLKVKSSNGLTEQRFAIMLQLKIGKRKINTLVTLSNRGEMKYPILIGRRFLRNKFIVDVAKKHLILNS